nr:immunoglobulin heavy chain junction region [Macaca mulatta]
CARSPPDYGNTYGDAFDFW